MSAWPILVVEDDSHLRQLLSNVLEKEGYTVRAANSLAQAAAELRRNPPRVVILDRHLPDGDGLELCRQLRSEDRMKSVAILFLTVKDSTADRVVGLKMGADDYLSKPFQVDELLARVDALLRRAKPAPPATGEPLVHQNIHLDLEAHECRVGSRSVQLWPKEFDLLKLFLERPGRVLSKDFLSERIWGHEFFANSRAVEVTIQRLRRKLGAKGRLIETIRSYGYKFREHA